MSGFIPIKRSLFEHFLFREVRVFSKFEAWLDLIQMASFTEDHTELINGKLVKTGRGEKIASMRFLMKRWNWSMSRVNDYLDLLRSQDMVVVARESGTNKIVLTNFKKHNDFSLENTKQSTNRYTKSRNSIDLPHNKGTPNDTQIDTAREQRGSSQGANLKKGNKFLKKGKGEITPTLWTDIKNSFLNSEGWQYKFCTEKKIDRAPLKEKMKEFISDLDLREEYKDLRELKNHFTNWFNKQKTSHGKTKQNRQHLGAVQPESVDTTENWGR